MTLYCFPTMQGRRGELEVGAGGPAHKRRSNHSRFICFWLPCLDDGVRHRPRKRKERDVKEGKEETMEVEEGFEGGPVWFEGAEGLIRVKNV